MTREQAEAHWHFIERLLRLENEDGMISIDTCGYLYIEAMLHGAKHERKHEVNLMQHWSASNIESVQQHTT